MDAVKLPTSDETELVRRFIAGDLQAFEDLYQLYAREVFLFLAARVDNQADAEDLLHDAWLAAKSNPGNFDGENFRWWFFRIARNKLYDFSKSARQRKKPSNLSDVQEPGREADSSARMSRDEELMALQDCINAVGGEFVEAVRRNKVDGESPEDIANDLGLDVGTVYSRIFRGKKKLRACLEKKLK